MFYGVVRTHRSKKKKNRQTQIWCHYSFNLHRKFSLKMARNLGQSFRLCDRFVLNWICFAHSRQRRPVGFQTVHRMPVRRIAYIWLNIYFVFNCYSVKEIRGVHLYILVSQVASASIRKVSLLASQISCSFLCICVFNFHEGMKNNPLSQRITFRVAVTSRLNKDRMLGKPEVCSLSGFQGQKAFIAALSIQSLTNLPQESTKFSGTRLCFTFSYLQKEKWCSVIK